MVVVELNGVPCSGKTTIVKMAERKGYSVKYIETSECMASDDAHERQKCFAETVYSTIAVYGDTSDVVYFDNGLLTVAAYTHMLLGHDAAAAVYDRWEQLIAEQRMVPVVLLVPVDQLWRRCYNRDYRFFPERRVFDVTATATVQAYLAYWTMIAERRQIPLCVVYSDREPEKVFADVFACTHQYINKYMR